MSLFSLKGKTILITGASSGIGAQCSIDLSHAGARVVLVARDVERLNTVLHQLEGDGHGCISYDLNQIVTEGGKSFVSLLVERYGKFDGFLHCAGIEKTQPLKLVKVADYEHIYRVNTLSAFEIIRQFCNKANFNDGGHIVLISSITSVIGRTGTAAYSASKGAMVSAMRAMVPELAKKRITINCISPGTILTPMMSSYLSTLTEEQQKKRIEGFPLGLGKTTDVSASCIYFLSDAANWVTGQNLIVDGGYTSL